MNYSDNPYFSQKITKEEEEKKGQSVREQAQQAVDPVVIPSLLRTSETGDKVYLVKDGIGHWITSPEVLQAVNGDFADVVEVKRDVFKRIRIGEKITLENASQFTLPKKVKEEEKQDFKKYDEPIPPGEKVAGTVSLVMILTKETPIQESLSFFEEIQVENAEKIIVDNGATEFEMQASVYKFAQKIIKYDQPKDLNEVANHVARICQGEYILDMTLYHVGE